MTPTRCHSIMKVTWGGPTLHKRNQGTNWPIAFTLVGTVPSSGALVDVFTNITHAAVIVNRKQQNCNQA